MNQILVGFFSFCFIAETGQPMLLASLNRDEKPKSPSFSAIKEELDEKNVVFIDHDIDFSSLPKRKSPASNTNFHPENEGTLACEYYYYNDDKTKVLKGELYATSQDNRDTIEKEKKQIAKELESGYYRALYTNSDVYMGAFSFGDAFISMQESTIPRRVQAIFNNEKLGTMVDYENMFLLNNPNNEKFFYLIVTHETYLIPTQTKNRNFKGVGVDSWLQLSQETENYFLRDYAPKAQSPSKTVSYSGSFGISGSFGDETSIGGNASFGFSYTKNVASPKIVDAGAMPYLMDIKFEYVDPGSWYGDFCAYNSGQTFQCSLAVIQGRKDISDIFFTSKTTGRFEKYENWPFPWVDEYYSINYSHCIMVSDVLNKIASAN